MIICFCQVNALLQTLQLQESPKRKGHVALYDCLVLGHTKNKGVQRISCNPFPAKPFYGSHHLDLVMIRPPGIDHGAFIISPSTVWYARVLLLFSASAVTDTGSKSFECALVSTLETYDDPENGNYLHYINYRHYCLYSYYINCECNAGWLKSVGSQILYELDHRKPVLCVIPIEHVLGKPPVVPVCDTGTIQHHLLNVFLGAPGP
jgi:hypothetical protein